MMDFCQLGGPREVMRANEITYAIYFFENYYKKSHTS